MFEVWKEQSGQGHIRCSEYGAESMTLTPAIFEQISLEMLRCPCGHFSSEIIVKEVLDFTLKDC